MFKISKWILPFFVLLQGCRSLPPLPPVDLKQPGWTVYYAEALWQPQAKAEQIAGELLVAFHEDGRGLAQFTKNPFPMVTARCNPEGWQIEIVAQNQRFARRGAPPDVLWFQLIRAFSGQPLSKKWEWRSLGAHERRLIKRDEHESLEIYVAE
jgi:hypothetical protein